MVAGKNEWLRALWAAIRFSLTGLPSFVLRLARFWLGLTSAARDTGSLHADKRITTGQVPLVLHETGQVNPAAIGWHSAPFVDASLSSAPVFRRKYWNYWAFTDASTGTFVAMTLADLDILGMAVIEVYDRTSGVTAFAAGSLPFGLGGDSAFPSSPMAGVSIAPVGNVSASQSPVDTNGNVRIAARGHGLSEFKSGSSARPLIKNGASSISIDLQVTYPPGHEQLHVVVPWSSSLYQYTAKHNTLPLSGTVELSLPGRAEPLKLSFGGPNAFACLDYGRGVWPPACTWNWGSFSGQSADGKHTVGLNLGGKWTDGTGTTENAICVDGRLYRIHGAAEWTYDTSNWLRPWVLKAPKVASAESASVDLVFTPEFDRNARTNAILVFSQVHQCLGTYSGRVTLPDGKKIDIHNVFGWAEEHVALW